MSDIPPTEPPPVFAEYPRDWKGWHGPPAVNLSVINRAWPMIQAQLSAWLLASLFAGMIFGAFYGAFFVTYFAGLMTMSLGSKGNDPTAFFGLFAYEMIGVGGLSLVELMLLSGLFRMALKQVKNEPIEALDFFKLDGQFFPLLLASILVLAAVVLGFIFCMLPAFILGGLLMFTFPLILDQKLSAVDAMKRSIDTLKPHLWMATLAFFVLHLLAQIGAYVCLVGVLFSVPLTVVSVTLMYSDFFLATPPTSNNAPPYAQM